MCTCLRSLSYFIRMMYKIKHQNFLCKWILLCLFFCHFGIQFHLLRVHCQLIKRTHNTRTNISHQWNAVHAQLTYDYNINKNYILLKREQKKHTTTQNIQRTLHDEKKMSDVDIKDILSNLKTRNDRKSELRETSITVITVSTTQYLRHTSLMKSTYTRTHTHTLKLIRKKATTTVIMHGIRCSRTLDF